MRFVLFEEECFRFQKKPGVIGVSSIGSIVQVDEWDSLDHFEGRNESGKIPLLINCARSISLREGIACMLLGDWTKGKAL